MLSKKGENNYETCLLDVFRTGAYRYVKNRCDSFIGQELERNFETNL